MIERSNGSAKDLPEILANLRAQPDGSVSQRWMERPSDGLNHFSHPTFLPVLCGDRRAPCRSEQRISAAS